MKRFLTISAICILSTVLIDRLLISKIPFLKYLDFLELGFELNKLAKTISLEGLTIFIGIGPFLILGAIIFYFVVKTAKFDIDKRSFIGSFPLFFNFFIAVMALNIIGGIAYYVCTLIPYIKSANSFFSDLILARIYLNLPLLDGFDYKNCYINFSIANLLGLFLLKTKYFHNAVNDFLIYFD